MFDLHPPGEFFRVPSGWLGDASAVNGGADLEEMNALGMPVASLRQDGTDYFDWHHTPDDTLDKIKATDLDQAVAVWSAFTLMVADSAVEFRAPKAATK